MNRTKATASNPGLFEVQNNVWKIVETSKGKFDLVSQDGNQSLTGLPGDKLVAANAVISELDRFLREGN